MAASNACKGIQNVLEGIIKYRRDWQINMLQQFQRVRDNPAPKAVFVTCVDSRMLPTRFTQTNVGDMFIVRNAGNMVPHSTKVSPDHVSTEPAVFELACVVNNIRHVVVCGHSDCKAINLLYDQHVSEKNLVENEEISFSPLRDWVTAHGNRSMAEFFRLESAKFRKPLLLNRLNKVEKFEAYVDVDEKFNLTDKLSMINTLLQMENVKSYRFMRTAAGGQVHVHAFWFDIYTGEIHIFSRKEKTFIVVNDETLPALESELNDICSKPDLIPSPTASKKKHPRSIGNLNQPTIKNLAEEVRQKFYQHDCASHQHH